MNPITHHRSRVSSDIRVRCRAQPLSQLNPCCVIGAGPHPTFGTTLLNKTGKDGKAVQGYVRHICTSTIILLPRQSIARCFASPTVMHYPTTTLFMPSKHAYLSVPPNLSSLTSALISIFTNLPSSILSVWTNHLRNRQSSTQFRFAHHQS